MRYIVHNSKSYDGGSILNYCIKSSRRERNLWELKTSTAKIQLKKILMEKRNIQFRENNTYYEEGVGTFPRESLGSSTIYTSDSDEQYSWGHFIDAARGNERYAQLLFERISGQSTYTLVDEDLRTGEIFERSNKFIFADELGNYVPKLAMEFDDNLKSRLEHFVLNQIESDFLDEDFDAISEMLQILMKDRKNIVILYNYLSDSGQKNFRDKNIKL